MASIARKALDLRLMSDRQYKYYIINIRRLGLPEPNQNKKENPTAWKDLIQYKVDRLDLDSEELQSYLNAPMEFIKQYMSMITGKPHLSLVKN